jgi:hypothetical protein
MAEVVTRSAPQVGAQSYVEWGAIIAGAFAALALSIVLLSFGAAIGLTSVSPYASENALKAVGIGSAFWLLLVTIWSFGLGGYLAGRMRHRWSDASATETRFRDCAHGLLAWSLAIVIAAILATSGLSALGRGLASASSASSSADQITATTDLLFRPSNATAAQPQANAAAPQSQSTEARAEASRLLTRSALTGGVSDADKTYLARLIASHTGLSQADAEQRVTTTLDEMKSAIDRARRIGILASFLAASILLIGAVTAWWAASVGGKHRDEGTVWQGFSVITRF